MNLVTRLRNAESCGVCRCRSMTAKAGCTCAEAADEIERLEREVHELHRTRSEAEAAANLKGYRDGTESVIRQLRAFELNITTDQTA